MEDGLGLLAWLALETLLVRTGKVLVAIISFGSWRAEDFRQQEGRIYSAAGALSFRRDGQRVITLNGLLFIGLGFYIALLARLICMANPKSPDRGHDTAVEAHVLNLMRVAKATQGRPLDLSGIPDFPHPTRVCFQGPYMMDQSAFQNATGIVSDKFEPQADDAIWIWWLVNAQNERLWVKVPRVVADKSPTWRQACADLDKERLFIDCAKTCQYHAE